MTDPVVVKVDGTGRAKLYVDLDDNGQRSYTERVVTLPYTFSVSGQENSVAIMAQEMSVPPPKTISCSISMGAMSMAANKAAGADAFVSCEADP